MNFAALALAAVAVLTTVQCGGSTTAATSVSGVSSVTLSASSVSAGATDQATVTLATAAPAAGATVTLLSSNAAVATVPASVTVAAGATSATFLITSIAPGSATIAASMNGASATSPALTVTARVVALASITLAQSTVIGGDNVNATATLTGPAPAGGAIVTLSGTDPAIVSSSVTVSAGATSGIFVVLTRVVNGTLSGTVTGSYGGVTATATVSVTKPIIATASFGVTGPTETETCEMASSTSISCAFNGTTSTAPGTITAYNWTYGAATMFQKTTVGPTLLNPNNVDCSVMPTTPLPSSGWFPMTVTLTVTDNLGNVSAKVTDSGARLFPNHTCGF